MMKKGGLPCDESTLMSFTGVGGEAQRIAPKDYAATLSFSRLIVPVQWGHHALPNHPFFKHRSQKFLKQVGQR
jgi:hypothetical protein